MGKRWTVLFPCIFICPHSSGSPPSRNRGRKLSMSGIFASRICKSLCFGLASYILSASTALKACVKTGGKNQEKTKKRPEERPTERPTERPRITGKKTKKRPIKERPIKEHPFIVVKDMPCTEFHIIIPSAHHFRLSLQSSHPPHTHHHHHYHTNT